ncbi:MAG: 3-oxoacyl-ACP synthase [Flavobacteriia bacterium]|nr:3-oxoacyl-ACP synthase [Flavobacteriia bacterium]NCT60703.1 3-oxoacyl-ACP synthase [Flavobacteriia bacterium]OIP47675.1 MAG: 3-oxoacyl-ACP synthase [Flavobacteriaceae bacterium CG2_30_31_66]PIY14723.1 MAG: 3-oxoacyl-ACP synthase [Flavobacteriaceae bacterium CG_4_10_14_3_um_filter_31_253]
MRNIKNELLETCRKFVENRLNTVQQTLLSYENDLQSETKSSAGDKHETGRAMLQLEMEKTGLQLIGINQMISVLDKIDISKKSKKVHLGSLVFTEKDIYFLSISAGKIIVENEVFYAISTSSPIGKLLLGKQENEQFVFLGNTIKIQKIV